MTLERRSDPVAPDWHVGLQFRRACLVILLVFVAGVARGEGRSLQVVGQIGVGWRDSNPSWMSFVSFSPDGTMVASDGPAGTDDASGKLTVWTFPAGQLVRQLPMGGFLSQDWQYYANVHEVGEVKSSRKVVSLPEQEDATFAFSPDGQYVAESLRNKGARIHLLELATGREVSAFGKYGSYALAISPDGKTLASGHWDVVILWNPFTGKRLATLRGFGRYVSSVAFSPDGERLAVGTDLGSLQIWDVRRRTRIHTLELGGQYVSVPVFTPDGRLVAAGVYGTGTVWLVDATTGAILDNQQVSDIGCGSAAFSPNGRFLITPSTGGLIRWPHDRGGTIRVFRVDGH